MEGTSVRYIEQNLLPFSFRIGQSVTFEESCRVIRTMNVRGAGAIGALAGFAMAQAASVAPETKYHDFLSRAKATIESTRPTARNLFHAVDLVFQAALVSREEAIREATGIADTDARDSRARDRGTLPALGPASGALSARLRAGGPDARERERHGHVARPCAPACRGQ